MNNRPSPDRAPKDTQPKPFPLRRIILIGLVLAILTAAGMVLIPAYLEGPTNYETTLSLGATPYALTDTPIQRFSGPELRGRYHFVEYCASCHGPKGKGNGPQSLMLSQRLPDFQNPQEHYTWGLTHDGIIRTLNEGIAGTEMPKFDYLPDNIKNDIASYVLYLKTHPGELR